MRSSVSDISEWQLEYRDDTQVLDLASCEMPARVWADATGAKLFLVVCLQIPLGVHERATENLFT